ncbi:MAG TPA: DUF2339 domain-containing protein [Acetobacteraceae bacterium]|nr:DUF2339 domain-containing protein [Acetobacteraceae bacterium]
MDDIVLLVVIAGVGWLLGVVGFFRTLGVWRELRELRRTVAGLHTATTPTTSLPQIEPMAAQPSAPLPQPEVFSAEPVAPLISVAEPVRAARPDIETLLTARWGVWLGSAALVLAGVFLVRYAVDQGLLGPAPRCVLAAILGVVLIAAAEWLRGHEILRPAVADNASPGLAAGGVAVLFGASYGAGAMYELVPPAIGFILMAAASVAGIVLSLRYGQLVGAVGLLGAFGSPALVNTENPSIPGLYGYLLFVTATALTVVRYAAWIWLGWATTIAGAAWVVLAVLGGAGSEVWAPALFVPAAAALNLGLLPDAALDHPIGRKLAFIPCAALGAAGLLLAIADQSWMPRIGVLLLAPLFVWHASREARLSLLQFLGAALFLALLATWRTEESEQSVLFTAALMSGFFAVSGLTLERRPVSPLPWASLAASIPVLALAICYTRITEFQPRIDWAGFAALLAAGLTGTTARALRDDARQRAGVHAAGAVAALALGCAMFLRDEWLTVAMSLFLPALAWIAAQVDLPPLRRVALTVATVVLVRLLLNWYVLDYGFGQWPVVNDLMLAYGVPGIAFALAAVLFRRGGDDATVGVLEAGSAAFLTVLVALEVRHSFGPPAGLAEPEIGFPEAALHVSSLGVVCLVTLHIAERLRRPMLHIAWRVQGALALIGGILLLVANPAVTDAPVGTLPLLDWLLPAYLLPALLAVAASRHRALAHVPKLRMVLEGYGLLTGLVWLTLEVRHLFDGDSISLAEIPVSDAELWAWSGAWLAYGVIVMGIGIHGGVKHVRLAALGIVGLAAAKVFLVDMSSLVGLWRVVSFLGLGLVLIGLGAAYRHLAGSPPSRPTEVIEP